MLMSVRLSVCLSVGKNIKRTNNQLKYMVIHSEKDTITSFELFSEGHSADTDSVIYDLWELQIQLFLNSYYSPPTSLL